MKKIFFTGETSFVLQNEQILKELGVVYDTSGIPIELVQNFTNELVIEKNKKRNRIQFQKPVHIFRGILIWLQLFEGEQKIEQIQFSHIGPMIDLSRNAVMNIPAFKIFLKKQARLGLDTCMLYMEDTFEVPEYPYFGYLRGRYTVDELKELDKYAENIGIELVPAIQTLGHLKNPFKWDFTNGMKDTDDILLVGENRTYEFIDSLIKTISKAFHTRRVHIGMDEAWALGSGNYLKKNGFHTQFEIMNQHLHHLIDITNKYQLKPIIWSDMYFSAASKTGEYYDTTAQFSKEMIDQIPEIELTLWDYYHTDEHLVEELLEKHLELSPKVSFAGGIWTWNGIAPNYGKAVATTEAGLTASKNAGIKDVYATLWGDDGQETSIDAAWFGITLYAHYQFNENPTLNGAKEDMNILLNENANDYLLLSKFDETPGISKNNIGAANPSKLLFYQDLFLDMFAVNFENMNLKMHYKTLVQELESTPKENLLFIFYRQFARVLVDKADLSVEIRRAYKKQNVELMLTSINSIENLIKDIKMLKKNHFCLWNKNYRTFGWEVLDVRYGGLISRLSTVAEILREWVNNPSITIEPLEETLLKFARFGQFEDDAVTKGLYENIITPSKLSGV